MNLMAKYTWFLIAYVAINLNYDKWHPELPSVANLLTQYEF